MPVITEAAGVWECSNEEYHADCSHVSHSSLEVFRRSSVRYYGQYIAKTLERPEPTPAMIIGSGLHCATLEPEIFESTYCVGPKFDRRTTAGKAGDLKFRLENEGKTFLSEDDGAQIQGMRDAIFAHDMARKLLEAQGRTELSVRWEHRSGVCCKARFDRILYGGIEVNLKTANDARPEEWGRQAYNLGYFRQTALYREGRSTLGIPQTEPLFHIVVSTSPPHEVAVYEIDPEFLRLGDAQNSADLEALARCRESGEWDNEWQIGIKTIFLPRWAKSER